MNYTGYLEDENKNKFYMGVVESDYTSDRSYIKFADGTMIQTKKLPVTSSVEAWGNIYFSDHDMGDWWIPFTQLFCYATNASSTVFWTNAQNVTSVSAGQVRCFRPTLGVADVTLFIIAFGRWR